MSDRARGVFQRTRVRLPIRLKLAIVSAALTFVILLLFALVVGAFTERKLMSSFDDDLRATAADLQSRFRVATDGAGPELLVDRGVVRAAAGGGAAIRVVARDGLVLGETRTQLDLGPPFEGLRDVGDYRVATRPLFDRSFDPTGVLGLDTSPIDGAVAFVQYAKPRRNLESTTARLELFLALGVLGGTVLAFLAGFAVARRAMRPIADLTTAAREVARTRDPAKAPPRSEARDEVGQLARTLDDMLRQLDAARGETESALDRQRDFVADASHELRTPLTSILANLELLEEELARPGGLNDPEAASDIASSALRSSRRMRRLVGDLLLLARADAGRRGGSGPVDLARVAAEAVTEAAPLAQGHHVSLDLPEDGDTTVEGSADDLHRLVLNLVENAMIHTPAGTPVVVSVRAEDAVVILEVADRGPGVAPERRERIFERFTRDAGDRTSAAGSGLGLAIVRAVSEAHGGTVELADARGGGALFTIRLPAAPALRSADGLEGAGVPDPKEVRAR
ncbi:MAG: HAMP domain-containing histidine kinase [Actinomycetota bacterium]|nr:HAMP domain-containing histidine kinase [Actinomycetota bacterium]